MKKLTKRDATVFNLAPTCAAILLAFGVQSVVANPLGGQVVNGSASFNTTGNVLTVTNTPGTIINWQGFSIQQNEITHFAQQTASSTVLNRVITNNPSQILGTLSSNGRVFLVNPGGIVFGAGSTVNVAGMVATSLNLSDADFLAGRGNFTNVPGAQAVSNAGNITAQSGGEIYLIAPNVENTGIITAPNGEILLAAGSEVQLVNSLDPNLRVNIVAPAGDATNIGQLVVNAGTLGLFGTVVRNSGVASADSATMQGGKIVFKASQRTEISGSVTALGSTGGDITIQGKQVALTNANINASGTNGGGTVLVGGDAHGANANVQNAQNTYVDAATTIKADAQQNGNGGKVVVWSDNSTQFGGNISAQGGALSGNGGWVEVSGKQWLGYAGLVNTTAAHGITGSLLLDPTDITISLAAQTGTMTWTAGTLTFADATTATSNLNVNTLVTQLGLSNVTVSSASGLAGVGNITVADSIAWTSANSLTLNAAGLGAITVNAADLLAAPLTITNTGTGGLNMLTAGGGITVNGAVTLAGGAFTVNASGATSDVLVNAAVNTGAGAINLTAGRAITEGAGGVLNTTGLLTTSSVAGQTLMNSANAVGSFNATNTTSGNVLLTNTAATLNVTGISNTVGQITVANTGAISISGAIAAGANTVGLSATGSLAEIGAGAISTGTLNTSSVGGTTLNGANTVTSFQAGNGVGGSVQFTNTAATLTVTGIISGGVAVTNTGAISIAGNITGTTVMLTGTGITNSATISGQNGVSLNAGTGTLSNATATSIINNGCCASTAAINLTADKMVLTLGTITAGTGAVNIGNFTLTDAIIIGSTTDAALNTLELSSAELGTITTGLMTVGGATNTGAITVSAATTLNNNTALVNDVGGIAVNGAVNAGLKNLTLNTTGAFSQTAGITAAGLELLGIGTNYTLTNAANAITTLAGNTGSVNLVDSTALAVGTVNSTIGLTASGNIALNSAGNIAINDAITAATVAPVNLVLNHGVAGSATLASTLALAGGNLDVQNAGVTGTGTLNVLGGNSVLSGLMATNLTVNNGNLSLVGITPTTLAAVTLGGGTLSNDAALTMGSLTINPGLFQTATLTGAGDKIVTGTTSFSPASVNSWIYLNGGILKTQGATSNTGLTTLYLGGGAIDNTGVWTMSGITLYGNQSGGFTNSVNGVVSVTGNNTVNVAFSNNSATAPGVTIGATGVLTLNGGGTSSGIFDAVSGGSLSFGSGIHHLTNPTSITGLGNVQFGVAGGTTTIDGSVSATNLWGFAGTATINGATNIANATMTGAGATVNLNNLGATGLTTISVSSGTLNVAGTNALLTSITNNAGILNLTDASTALTLSTFGMNGGITNIAAATTVPTLNWNGGEIGGVGALNLTTSMVMSPATSNSVTLNGKTLNVSGATTQGALVGVAPAVQVTLNMSNGAIINNTGAWTMNEAQILDVDLVPTSLFNNNPGGSVNVAAGGFGWINGTTLVANGGTTSGQLAIDTMVVNSITDLTNLTIKQSLINNSTATVGIGATNIYGHVTNNGTFDVLLGGTANINGNFTNTNTGTLAVAGTFNAGKGTVNDGTVSLNGGTLNGILTNNNLVNASGGTFGALIDNSLGANFNVSGAALTLTLNDAFNNYGTLRVNGDSTLAMGTVWGITNFATGSVLLGDAVSTGTLNVGISTLNNSGAFVSNSPAAGANQINFGAGGGFNNNSGGVISVLTGLGLVLNNPANFDSQFGGLDVNAGSMLQVSGGTVNLSSSTVMGAGGGVVLLSNNGATGLTANMNGFINPVVSNTHLGFANSNLVAVNGYWINQGTIDISGITLNTLAGNALDNQGTVTFSGTQNLLNYYQSNGAVLQGTVAGAVNNNFFVTGIASFNGTTALDNLTLNLQQGAGLASLGYFGAPAVLNMQNGAIINSDVGFNINGTIQDLSVSPLSQFNNLTFGTVTVDLGNTGVVFGTTFSNVGMLTVNGTWSSGTFTNAGLMDITGTVQTNSIINNGTLQVSAGAGTINGSLVNNNLFDVTNGTAVIKGAFTNNVGATTNLNVGGILDVGMGGANYGTVNMADTSSLIGPVAFNNFGSFNVNTTLPSFANIGSVFNNNGVVTVGTGSLAVSSGGKGSGVFNLDVGTTLKFGSGYNATGVTAISAISGAGGDVEFLGGPSLIEGAVTANSVTQNWTPIYFPYTGATVLNGVLNIGTLNMVSGTLSNAQVMNLNTLNVLGTTTLAGSGAVNVATALNMSTAFASVYINNLTGKTLTNNGTATLGNFAEISGNPQGVSTFVNAGALNVVAGGGSISAYLDNTGTINIGTGNTLTLLGGGTSTLAIDLVAAARLDFGSSNNPATYAMNITGVGDVSITSSSPVNIAGSITANNLTANAIDGTYNHAVGGAVTVGSLTTFGMGGDNLVLNGQLNATTVTNGVNLLLNSASPNTIADLSNDGFVGGTGNLHVTNSFVQNTGTLGVNFTDIAITQTTGDLILGGLTTSNSISLAATSGNLTTGNLIATGNVLINAGALISIDGSITSGVIEAHGTGVTLAPATTLSASSIGDAVVLDAGTGNFTNNAGAGVMNLTGGGRWLVYSSSPLLDTRGGLVYNFKQYNTVFGGAVLGTGSGFIHTLNPTVSVGLTGTVSKVYDSTTGATLGAANFLAVSGAIDGDSIATPIAGTGTYIDKNVGTGKAVAVSGSLTASNGAATVYGYQYTSSGFIGDITQASLTISGITAANKVYDATTAATVNTAGATYTGLFAGDVVNVNATGVFADKNVANGKAVTLTSGYTGADMGNYLITDQASALANITQLGSVTWTGNGQTNLWSDAANWAGGALPDGANVASVIIPISSIVVYDSSVGSTTLGTLFNNGSLTVADGSLLTVLSSLSNTSNLTLNVQGTLNAGFTTNTGTINIANGMAPTFNATAGLNNLGIINIGDQNGSTGSSTLAVAGTLNNTGAINSIGTVGSRMLNAGTMFNTGVITVSYPMTIGGVSYAAGSVLKPVTVTVDTNVVETITDIVMNFDVDNNEPVVLALNESEEKKKAEENAETVEGLQNNENVLTTSALPVCQ